MLLGKTKLDIIEVLISKALIDSYISYEFVSVNNVLREHNEIKKKEKILKLLWNILCKNNGKVLHQLSCKKYTASKHLSVRKSSQKGLMLLWNCTICGKKKLTFIKIKNSTILSNNWND